MILEAIKNMLKPKKQTIKNRPMREVKISAPATKTRKRDEYLPKHMYYDKTNKKYRITKKGIHYGYYNTKEEGIKALQLLIDSDWDIRVAQGIPTDLVYFDETTRKYIIHKPIQGIEYNFGEYKRAHAVQRRLNILEEKNYPSSMGTILEKDIQYKLQENTEPEHTLSHEIESPYYREKYPQGSYYYDIQHDCFTLPNKQGKSLNITGVEAFTMIKLYNKGYNLKDIYEKVEWSNPDTRYSTLKTWWRKFNEGLMDLALNFIIRSGLISSELWRN